MGGSPSGILSPRRHLHLDTRMSTISMGSVADLLSGMGPEIEAQLKPNLRGFFGGMIRAYLPQAWVFTTEAENVTLYLDTDGNVSVRGGSATSLDVIIQGTNAALLAALGTRNAAMVRRDQSKRNRSRRREAWPSISFGIVLVSRRSGLTSNELGVRGRPPPRSSPIGQRVRRVLLRGTESQLTRRSEVGWVRATRSVSPLRMRGPSRQSTWWTQGC